MIRRGLMLLGLLLLCVGLYRLPESVTRQIDLAAFLPARSALAGTTDRGPLEPGSQTRLERLSQELRDLRAQFEQMDYYSTLLDAKPPSMFGARIFLRGDMSSWRQSCYIDAGSKDGVAVGQAVADEYGLIGTVSAVSKTYSRVALLTDPVSKVRAYVRVRALVKDSEPTTYPVMAEGTGGKALLLRFAPLSAPIRKGDPVFTTGSDGRIPRNLLLGVVKTVRSDDTGLVHEISVTPVGRVRTAVNVVVFLRTKPPELDS